MKRIAVLVVCLVLALPLITQAQDLGKGVGGGKVYKVSEILDKPTDFIGRTVVVEGMIVDVCRARGCWVDLAGDKPGQKLKIKVEDGVIIFPMEARGKRAKVQGMLEELKLSKEEALEAARHYSKESGAPFDSSKVKEGVQYRIKATGAVIQ